MSLTGDAFSYFLSGRQDIVDLMPKIIRTQGGAEMWIERSNENLGALFGEISQEITRRGDLGLDNLRTRFPKFAIGALKKHQSRFPYLDEKESRNIACALQLCDVNRWFNKYFDLGLTAGSMWEWQITLPIAAIIETLLRQYIKLQGWQSDKDGFEGYIDEFAYKDLFDNDLQERLHSLRDYRNKIHLYLNDHIPISNGDRKMYNEATDLLFIVEDILIEHWEWSETIKLIVSDYFKTQLSESKYNEILNKNILEAFTKKSGDYINRNDSYDGMAKIIKYGTIESPILTDLCFFPDNKHPVTFDFTAVMNIKIKYAIKNDLQEDLQEEEDIYVSFIEKLSYITSITEENSKIKIIGRVILDRNNKPIKKAEGAGMDHFVLSVKILKSSNILECEEYSGGTNHIQPIEFYSPEISLLDVVKTLYSNKHIVLCNGIKALNENTVVVVDSKSEAQFYEQIFDLIQTNKSYTYRKIKFIIPPAESNVTQIADIIHSARIRVVCIIKREKLRDREYFRQLLHSFGIIMADYSYAMDLYDRKYTPQKKVSGMKNRVDRGERENTDKEWDNLIKLLHNIGIFILPEITDKQWLAGFFESDRGNPTIMKAIKDLSRLKNFEKHETVFEQHSWNFMYTLYREIRYLQSRNFNFRQSIRER